MGFKFESRALSTNGTSRKSGPPMLRLSTLIFFMMAHHSPAVYGLTSPDGALRFPPLVCSGSSKTCAFAANAMPAKFKRATKKYFDTHAPRALEANYKLDLLLMEAVHALNYGINQVTNSGV